MTTDPADLARLTPNPGTLNRDAILFAAGKAAGRSGPGWKVTAGLLALGNVALAVAWGVAPPPAPVTVVVEVPAPVPTPPPAVTPSETSPADPVWLTQLPVAPEGADPSSYAVLLRTWSHPRPPAGSPPPPRPTLTAGSDPRFLGLN